MTINSINYSTVIPLAKEWKDKINKIGFQFHTPFSKDDPLWLPFGDIRNKIVEEIITLEKTYPDYIANTDKQISLMKGNWGVLIPHLYNVHLGLFYHWITLEELNNHVVLGVPTTKD